MTRAKTGFPLLTRMAISSPQECLESHRGFRVFNFRVQQLSQVAQEQSCCFYELKVVQMGQARHFFMPKLELLRLVLIVP